MGDGYFYTLSAIAQSFAAIIALNAVFVIYKLQTISNLYNELFKQARQWWVRENSGPCRVGVTFEQYKTESDRLSEKDLRHWLKQRNGQRDIVEQKKKINDKIETNDNLKRKIFYWFKRTLISDGIVIASSLILLPLRDCFQPMFQGITIAIILFASCITLAITLHAVLITAGFKGLRYVLSSGDKQN